MVPLLSHLCSSPGLCSGPREPTLLRPLYSFWVVPWTPDHRPRPLPWSSYTTPFLHEGGSVVTTLRYPTPARTFDRCPSVTTVLWSPTDDPRVSSSQLRGLWTRGTSGFTGGSRVDFSCPSRGFWQRLEECRPHPFPSPAPTEFRVPLAQDGWT